MACALIALAETHAHDNGFIGFDARAVAAAFDAPTPDAPPDGPLAGIPFAVKDNIDALPFPTTGGCPALGKHHPATDAPAVARVRAAGARLVGKTNLHELAIGVTSNNTVFGPVRNPYDRRRIAGGSSGGNGAVIARGIVPFALGTDTGGSVRIPAAFCDIAGFRPTSGRYPDGGVLMLSPTRDTVGVMAATVADAALVDAVIAPAEDVPLPAWPLRLGVLAGARAGLAAVVDATIAAALDRLADAGVALVPVDDPELEGLEERMGNAIVICEAAGWWHRFTSQQLGLSLMDFAEEIASPDVRDLFERMEALAIGHRPDYRAAMAGGRAALQARCAALFAGQGLDALVTATVPVQPPLIGEDDDFMADGIALPTLVTLTRASALASIAGLPSLSIPAGLDRSGLPVGLQLDGPAGSDRRLLAIGEVVEKVLDGVPLSPRGRGRGPLAVGPVGG